jgi:3-methylcrotonyl-CoA carboxylase alpha subunit
MDPRALMFSRLLIANRGEIACRIIRSCQRLGIHTIAVHSAADAHARHVRLADEALDLGGLRPDESYLRIDRIVELAAGRGAQAIHPGYGFLSENAAFAAACEAAGIVFVGPDAGTIRLMGSKSEARRIMADAGVPVVPGYDGEDQEDDRLLDAARAVGFPVMLKASAGGGGKGMRIVRDEAGWGAALAGARREAAAAFGDQRMIVERYVREPRHVEVQIIGDRQGHMLHLFERECSIQRRHQKIIEESPSPIVDEDLRRRLTDAAVAAARAVDYVNAGTVEFLLDASGEFFFMEMNTRLQVEHPVTEAITGVDLVEWQLRVAAGEPLPCSQEDIVSHGHAIEARLYAENPFNDFLPATGRIGRFVHGHGARDLRVDTGVEDGDEVSIHYDPMLAKLIVWGPDRPAAVERLRHALARTLLTGPTTNLPLLRSIAGHPDFAAAKMDTAYLDQHLDKVLAALPAAHDIALIAAACSFAAERPPAASAADPWSAWDRSDGWRVGGGGLRMRFEDAAGERYEIVLGEQHDGWIALLDDRRIRVRYRPLDTDHVELQVDDADVQATVLNDGSDCFVGLDFGGYELRRLPLYQSSGSDAETDAHPGAPMPGRIVAIHVREGDTVEPGQPLLVMEGMKMEYTLASPMAGVVRRVLYGEGDSVEAETPLVDIDPRTEA